MTSQNITKTSTYRILSIISILLLILGYIGFKQSTPPSAEINSHEVSVVDDLSDKLELYKQRLGSYPDIMNGKDLAIKIGYNFNEYSLKYIYYTIPNDKGYYILGLPLIKNDSLINRTNWGRGDIYKNFYYRTSSSNKFTSEEIEKIYMQSPKR